MAVSNDYLIYIQDQLHLLGVVRSKRMFGGAGLYLDDLFFAIVADDELYLKVDDCSRLRYKKRGLKPFSYQTKKGTMTMSYYPLPAEVIEDNEQLIMWAEEARQVAVRARKKKP